MNDQQLSPEDMALQVRRLICQLQAMGRNDLLLKAIGVSTIEKLQLEAAKGRLQPLRITSDCRMFVGQREVELQPVHKAVYLLFLAHPEGIEFKRLANYEQELTDYYMKTARMFDKQKIKEGVSHLIDPLDNAINEKCSRIKKVFSEMMDEYSASYYIISGHVQKRIEGSNHIWYERLKVITLPRNLIVYED
ncbi:MAG: hypothetical protein K5683_10545 [Prevotella sp.]|nr:hypothetical protein [Prevotella sp.]